MASSLLVSTLSDKLIKPSHSYCCLNTIVALITLLFYSIKESEQLMCSLLLVSAVLNARRRCVGDTQLQTHGIAPGVHNGAVTPLSKQ